MRLSNRVCVCVCVFWVRFEIRQGDAKERRNVVGWRNVTEMVDRKRKLDCAGYLDMGLVWCHEMPAVLVAARGL